MCQSKHHSHNRCQHPERLQGRPGDWSPEQITKCHGDEKEHSCCQEG
jgi:hypothetical protein